MGLPDGVHHLAICTRDIKEQIAFFSDVLGMELVALYWMHGVPNAWHGFLRLGDSSYVAFVQSPEVGEIEREIGRTHAGNAGAPVAGGAMQHVALNVGDDEELLAIRDRIRSRGVHVFGPIDHGLCKSIYFAGPENLSLEIATSERAIDGRAWIDPEVVDLAGITAVELERFRSPDAFQGRGGAAPQPPDDASKPRLTYPPSAYAHLLAMSDEEFTASMSQTEPPVTVKEA